MVLLKAYTQTVAFSRPKTGRSFATILRNHFLQSVADFPLQVCTHAHGICPRIVPLFAAGGGAITGSCSVAEALDGQYLVEPKVSITRIACVALLYTEQAWEFFTRYALGNRHAIGRIKQYYQCARRMRTPSDIARVCKIDTVPR